MLAAVTGLEHTNLALGAFIARVGQPLQRRLHNEARLQHMQPLRHAHHALVNTVLIETQRRRVFDAQLKMHG